MLFNIQGYSLLKHLLKIRLNRLLKLLFRLRFEARQQEKEEKEKAAALNKEGKKNKAEK